MGETIPNDGVISFEVYVNDPDNEGLVSLELYTDQGLVLTSTAPTANPTPGALTGLSAWVCITFSLAQCRWTATALSPRPFGPRVTWM